MRLNHFIEELIELQERGFGNCHVKIVEQPNYPLMSNIRGVTTTIDVSESEEEINENIDVVYIACSDATEYGPNIEF